MYGNSIQIFLFKCVQRDFLIRFFIRKQNKVKLTWSKKIKLRFGVRNDLFLTTPDAASKGTGLDYCPSAVYLKLDIQP